MDWVILGQQLWYGLVNGILYILFASGLTLAFGSMGILNMTHGELCMLGAIFSYSIMTSLGLGYLLSSVLSVLLVCFFGVVLNRIAIQPLIRVSRLTVLVSTFGLSFLIVNASLTFWGVQPRQISLPLSDIHEVGGVRITDQSIILVCIGGTAILLFYAWLSKARLGKAMRATAQNPVGASLSGINTKRIYDYTMMVSAGLAGLSGVLLAPVLSAHPNMGQPLLLVGLVIVIVGGLGNLKGTIVVGLLIAILEALFGQYVSTFYRSAFIYGIMIVVLLFKPQGLFAKR
jgi:branched-chain amino acid transport system permease protein